jgi:hypothetical protein
MDRHKDGHLENLIVTDANCLVIAIKSTQLTAEE